MTKPNPAVTPEPAPRQTDSPAVWPLVIETVGVILPDAPAWLRARLREDMLARHESGLEKYGVPLQVENGRRADVDAYQEALDLCVYSRQQVERTGLGAWRKRKVYLVHNDTLVENPVMVTYAREQLAAIQAWVKRERLPVECVITEPDIRESFWFCLLGMGYPTPWRKFRWCTTRLKIRPGD